jgi:hypothetical protein
LSPFIKSRFFNADIRAINQAGSLTDSKSKSAMNNHESALTATPSLKPPSAISGARKSCWPD